MRTVPERSPWAQLVVAVLLLVGGPWGALELAQASAPSSRLVQSLAPLAFAGILAGGLLLWMGMGMVWVAGRFLWRVARGRNPRPDVPRASKRLVPPGYRAFSVLGVAAGAVLGMLCAVLTDWTLAPALALWMGSGAAYGSALWGAAHQGYLPFPEPE
ncbi:MAG TPA: hypothetical protein VLH75_19220 [Longimicrobiales bacterium]|nr:hypothetical protein [Longimicrobiales bacterium]